MNFLRFFVALFMLAFLTGCVSVPNHAKGEFYQRFPKDEKLPILYTTKPTVTTRFINP
jgi:starvation-inducible outer membrane lipoprotein